MTALLSPLAFAVLVWGSIALVVAVFGYELLVAWREWNGGPGTADSD